MFEKVIYDQTWKVFHNVLSSKLSGFMKTHSCYTKLLQMTEDWKNSIDNKEAIAAVAVDLSKATCPGNDVRLPAGPSKMCQCNGRVF